MACKIANDYKLVDDEPSLKDAISELKQKIEHNTLLAVDCEGVNLSREGTLTIITVATEEKIYIFDVLKLGQVTFSSGLGQILEDKSSTKLTFDCRQDSDALWHQFRIKLTGVLDLQLLEVIYRRENNPPPSTASSRPSRTKYGKRRSQRTDEVESIYGFRRCLELYVKDEDFIKIKDKGRELMEKYDEWDDDDDDDDEEEEDDGVWKRRPLPDELIQYCAVDTIGMFKLYNKIKDVTGGEEARLRVASEKYADLYRGKSERLFNGYETNAFLPLDIIPDKGTLDFPYANTECTCCKRRFPREEFSVTQLSKGEQKCRVCKEIKRRADVQKNREDNWRRLEEEAHNAAVCWESDEETGYSFWW